MKTVDFNPSIYGAGIAFVSAVVITTGFMMLLSGFYSAQTQLHLNQWTKNDQVTNAKSWELAHNASLKSQQWYPSNNGFIEEKIGKVYQWQTYNKLPTDKAALQKRLKALTAYRNQIEITPNWPEAWLNLLRIKTELSEFDNEFYHAFNQAKITAKTAPKVHSALSIVAIQSWHGLNKQAKSDAINIILQEASSSKRKAQKIKPVLQSYNLLGLSCLYSNINKTNTNALCK